MKAHNKSIADLTESSSMIKLIYSTAVPHPPQNDFKEYIRHFRISLSPNSCISHNYSYFAMCKLSFITMDAHGSCVTLVSAKKTLSNFENKTIQKLKILTKWFEADKNNENMNCSQPCA